MARSEGIRTIKCGADERRRRRLDGDEPLFLRKQKCKRIRSGPPIRKPPISGGFLIDTMVYIIWTIPTTGMLWYNSVRIYAQIQMTR